jgi:hypothetical protein
MIVCSSWPHDGDDDDGRPDRRPALTPAAPASVMAIWAAAALTVLVVLVLKLLV